MSKWTSNDIPSMKGRSAVVTGTGGLGFECALALSRAGADVTIAGRNPAKGWDALSRIKHDAPEARVHFEALDLASLASVEQFGSRLCKEKESVDILINNAGVMMPPTRKLTEDGFELQLGTNYLGHFALTGHLLPALRKSNQPRVISVSSIAARQGKINFDDLRSEKSYSAIRAYGQSKLACLMFALELQRRSEANGWGISSIAAHPGISRTELLANGPGRMSPIGIISNAMGFLFQPAVQGALPLLFAATSLMAQGGSYYGPDRMGETRGYPAAAKVSQKANDATSAVRLCEVSEGLTNVAF